MGETTHIEEPPFSTPVAGSGRVGIVTAGEKFRLGVRRTVLWSYERGTWQYDVICLVILAFIFLTPRGWLGDRPTLQLTNLQHNQGVVELARDKTGRTYMIDARLVESLGPIKLEDAFREILRHRLPREPLVKSYARIQDKNNVLLGYTVVVGQ